MNSHVFSYSKLLSGKGEPEPPRHKGNGLRDKAQEKQQLNAWCSQGVIRFFVEKRWLVRWKKEVCCTFQPTGFYWSIMGAVRLE